MLTLIFLGTGNDDQAISKLRDMYSIDLMVGLEYTTLSYKQQIVEENPSISEQQLEVLANYNTELLITSLLSKHAHVAIIGIEVEQKNRYTDFKSIEPMVLERLTEKLFKVVDRVVLVNNLKETHIARAESLH